MSQFDEYIVHGEPGQRERAAAWQTAIGLQDVDGLKVSQYLIEEARQHIEGELSIDDVLQNLKYYYETKTAHDAQTECEEEADRVSSNIVKLLGETGFTFSVAGLTSIHRRIFEGVFKHAGKIREYNITKKEWVLDGDTVHYGLASEIIPALEYDLQQEKLVNYATMSLEDGISRIAQFASGIWQIHPFREGNTRTTAVFLIKYLRSMGFKVTNDLFADKSFFFRNALARANYQNIPRGISYDYSFLSRFFHNLLLNESYTLSNREIKASLSVSQRTAQSAKHDTPKCKICTLNCTLEEIAVLNVIKSNPKTTQKSIAATIGKSERTVKTLTSSLVERGILVRRNGKRNGWWEILTQLDD